jgi:16S rRNA (guanine527-N7)-methyltransferase
MHGPVKRITDEAIALILGEYGVVATPAWCLAIQKYISVLLRWNEKIALTTVTDLPDIVRFHFGESMFGASAVPIKEGRLADVGTGAGFPGLPLKLVLPSLDLVLIESNAKKASFLSECIRELNLTGVEVYRGRFEDIRAEQNRFDFVAARALGGYSNLLTWSQRQLAPKGALVLWLGERDAMEIRRSSNFNWRAPVPITGSDRRVLLIGTRS